MILIEQNCPAYWSQIQQVARSGICKLMPIMVAYAPLAKMLSGTGIGNGKRGDGMSLTRSVGAGVALILLALIIGSAARVAVHAAVPSADRGIEVHIYSQPGCPYCQRAKAFLRQEQTRRSWLTVIDHDIQTDAGALLEFEALIKKLQIEKPGVPLIVIGGTFVVGFDLPRTTGADLIAVAERCRFAPCRNLRAEAVAQVEPQAQGTRAGTKNDAHSRQDRQRLPESITLPLFGSVKTQALSLPVLTVVLAAVDGFNPCAMWVLVFLIGLLLGMTNRTKMWALGAAFLLTSGVVYFLFLSAWLNVFLFLGALLFIRLAVAGFAFVAGLFYLHEFALHSEAYCRVTNVDQRRHIMDALKRTVLEKRFAYALGGIIILAAAVNLIELLCSAGLPAVFTNVLSMSNLPVWQYYMYLALYILVFLADDILIFVTAMLTLQATGLTETYSRYSHLIGGCAMVMIGILLVFRPDWLAFA